MRYRRFGDRYIVRLDSGEPVREALAGFLRSEAISFANPSAAGAVRAVRLGYWQADSRTYVRR